MDGHSTSSEGRCEEIPDPSEVSSLGKLNVFLISYNLISLNDIIMDGKNLSCEVFDPARKQFNCIWHCLKTLYIRFGPDTHPQR
jgi:hypothetical protein